MNRITFRSLLDELESIEKDAGIKDLIQAVRTAASSKAAKAKKLTMGVAAHPKVRKVMDYMSDPTNIADLSHSVANIASRFG